MSCHLSWVSRPFLSEGLYSRTKGARKHGSETTSRRPGAGGALGGQVTLDRVPGGLDWCEPPCSVTGVPGKTGWGGSAASTFRAAGPGRRPGWVWQLSRSRWFRPPTRSGWAGGSRGCRPGGGGPGRNCNRSGGDGRGGGRCRSGGAGRGWAESPALGRPGMTFPRPAGAEGGAPAAEGGRERAGEDGRNGRAGPGQPGRGPGASAGRRATQGQGTPLRNRAAGAGGERGAGCAPAPRPPPRPRPPRGSFVRAPRPPPAASPAPRRRLARGARAGRARAGAPRYIVKVERAPRASRYARALRPESARPSVRPSACLRRGRRRRGPSPRPQRRGE